MRVFTLIFAIWILVLSMQPCADILASVDAQGHGVEIGSHIDAPSHENRGGGGSDECSPFCICSCCSITVVNQSIACVITEQFENFANPTTPSGYTNPYHLTRQNTIWQPPKA